MKTNIVVGIVVAMALGVVITGSTLTAVSAQGNMTAGGGGNMTGGNMTGGNMSMPAGTTGDGGSDNGDGDDGNGDGDGDGDGDGQNGDGDGDN